MIYDDNDNPFDMNELAEISDYFQNIRNKYSQYEGSMKGVDIKMLINQVPGGMLSILEKQLILFVSSKLLFTSLLDSLLNSLLVCLIMVFL